MSLKIFFLDLNSFFASVEQQENPAWRGKPLIVVPTLTDSTSAIAASYEAKALGIKTNTPVWQAKQLCPDIIITEGRHDKYVEYHHKIKAAIEVHLHIDKVCSIDEVACRLPKRWQASEWSAVLAHEIRREIWSQVGGAINCSIGIAPTRLLAKMASDYRKPCGLTIVTQADIERFMQQLALNDIPGVGRQMTTRLNRSGIWTAHDFWSLSQKQARRLWKSVEGERLWLELHGVEVPRAPTTRRMLGHSHVLAPDLRPLPVARLVARRLASKATARLRRLGYTAQILTLSLKTTQRLRVAQEVKLPVPTQDSFTVLHSLEHLWQSALKKLADDASVNDVLAIQKIAVSFSGLSLATSKTSIPLTSYFETDAPYCHDIQPEHKAVCQAIDVLNQRFGRDAVHIGALPKINNRDRTKMTSRAMGTYSGTKIAFTRIPDMAEFKE